MATSRTRVHTIVKCLIEHRNMEQRSCGELGGLHRDHKRTLGYVYRSTEQVEGGADFQIGNSWSHFPNSAHWALV